MSGVTVVGYFLFSVVFSFILFVLWARFALSFFRVSTFFAMSQTIFRLTNPIVMPVYILASRFVHKKSRYDWSCLITIFIIELIKYALLGPLFFGALLPGLMIVLLSLISMVIDPCNFLFYAILARVILSWVSPTFQNPLTQLIYTVTEPMLYRIRKMLPTTGGLDFSPLIALIFLKVITLFLVTTFPLTA